MSTVLYGGRVLKRLLMFKKSLKSIKINEETNAQSKPTVCFLFNLYKVFPFRIIYGNELVILFLSFINLSMDSRLCLFSKNKPRGNSKEENANVRKNTTRIIEQLAFQKKVIRIFSDLGHFFFFF